MLHLLQMFPCFSSNILSSYCCGMAEMRIKEHQLYLSLSFIEVLLFRSYRCHFQLSFTMWQYQFTMEC